MGRTSRPLFACCPCRRNGADYLCLLKFQKTRGVIEARSKASFKASANGRAREFSRVYLSVPLLALFISIVSVSHAMRIGCSRRLAVFDAAPSSSKNARSMSCNQSLHHWEKKNDLVFHWLSLPLQAFMLRGDVARSAGVAMPDTDILRSRRPANHRSSYIQRFKISERGRAAGEPGPMHLWSRPVRSCFDEATLGRKSGGVATRHDVPLPLVVP